MFEIKSILRTFIFGFLLAFILVNFTMCPTDTTNPSDNPNPSGNESAELKKYNSTIESLLTSGNTDEMLKQTVDNYVNIFKNDVQNNPEKVKKMGEAFKSKKLVYANQFYAEYELTIEGKVYTIALCNSGDGNWKLMRY